MNVRVLFGRVLGLGLLVVFLALVACTPPTPLPILGEVPEFHLQDQSGQPYSRARLLGKVTAVGFIFTRCPTICPLLSKRMSEIQSQTAGLDSVQLLSITVDPKHDKPQELTRHGKSYKADFKRWSLVTGAPEEIRRLTVQGFKTAIGDRQDQSDGAYDILHSTHVVLVDKKARIRGYVGLADGIPKELFGQLKQLSKER